MRVLVTGSSGFLGREVVSSVPTEHDVIPASRRDGCDLTQVAMVDSFWNEQSPEAVIHLAAESSPEACQQDPEATRRINVDTVAELAGRCHRGGLPFVLASTDLVFAGDSAPYGPDAGTGPLSAYGAQKVEAEAIVREAGGTVARLPLMYGPGPGNFAWALLESWRQAKVVDLFTDEFRTPALASDVARCLWQLIGESRSTVHLGGPTRISRHEFGLLLAGAVGMSPDLVRPVLQADLHLDPPRPADVSLVETDSTVTVPAVAPEEGVTRLS